MTWPRVDIWRDQCDQRSRNFFCQLRKFLEEQWKMCYNFNPKWLNLYSSLHKLRKFVCYFYAKYVISIHAYTYFVNLCATFSQICEKYSSYTYCVNLCATFTQNVWFTLFWRELGQFEALRSFVANWIMFRFTHFLRKILASKTTAA